MARGHARGNSRGAAGEGRGATSAARRGDGGPPLAPSMREAWRLFDAGDKVLARRHAEQVLAHAPSEQDAAQARALLERTSFPRFALAAAGFALLVFVALLLLAVLRG
jgi:hypothetical protein